MVIIHLVKYDSHSYVYAQRDAINHRGMVVIGHFRDKLRARKVALAISFLLNCKMKEKTIHAT